MAPTKIQRLEGGEVTGDGATIRLRFVAADGTPTEIEIETESLENAFDAISGLLNKAVENRQLSGGPAIERYLPALGFRAYSPVDPGYILLSFALRGGLERTYSIATESADKVCREIREAAEQSRRLRPLTRQ
jgi:hypothetical protein